MLTILFVNLEPIEQKLFGGVVELGLDREFVKQELAVENAELGRGIADVDGEKHQPSSGRPS